MADPLPPDAATCPPALNIGLMSYERVTFEMRKALPGITAEQIQTFITIVRHGRCTQTEISKSTGFTRQAVSRHVAKLMKAGLLAQRRDLENGRRRVVRLTALGRLVRASLGEPSRRTVTALADAGRIALLALRGAVASADIVRAVPAMCGYWRFSCSTTTRRESGRSGRH